VLIVPAPVRYPDISQWQTTFDAATFLGSGYSKVSIRATYGTTGTDPLFASRWEAMAGITRQAYCFAYPGDGAAMAQHLLSVVDGAGGFHSGDEAMLDLEALGVTPEQAATIAPAWCRTISAAEPNVRVLIYGNEWFIDAANLTPDELPNVGLVIASYGANPVTPPGWPHVCVWQSADNAVVPGFPAPVDINQVICPSNLDHLSIGDDTLSQADIDAINAHTDSQINGLLTLIGQRFTSLDLADKQLASALQVLYGRQKPDGSGPVDPTHTGIGDVARALGLLPDRISSAVSAHVTGGVDQTALEAAVKQAVTDALASLTLKASA
jgi:GH25 family lysozyme M1 (1,4-beta-N-acetylmuramidase)